MDNTRNAAIGMFGLIITTGLCSTASGAAAPLCSIIAGLAAMYLSSKIPGGFASWYGKCHKGNPRGSRMSATVYRQITNSTRIVPSLFGAPKVYNTSWGVKWATVPKFTCV
ncbi:hypothetical protein ACQPZJ_21700 [Actinoplanes sp. CA-054009]